MSIVAFLFVGCGFLGLFFGCPGDGSTERVQIRNEADVQISEIRNNADIEQAYAQMEAQIGVAQAEASANIAWANAASTVGVAEAEAMVQINQAWAIALIVFALGLVGIWSLIFSQMRPTAAPTWTGLEGAQRPALDPPTWRALENEAQQRGQRLEMDGTRMLLIDNRTNAIVAERQV